MMKVLFFVCVIAFAVQAKKNLTDEQKAQLKEVHEECLKVSHVDEAIVKKAEAGDYSEDDKLKEHVFCIAKKIGFMDDKGDFNIDVLKAKMKEEYDDEKEIEDILTKCAVKKDTPQETAYQSFKCYFTLEKEELA